MIDIELAKLHATSVLRRRLVEDHGDGDTGGHLARQQVLRKPAAGQREVIALHHLADLTAEQVADQRGLPTGTATARLARGPVALSTLPVKVGPHA